MAICFVEVATVLVMVVVDMLVATTGVVILSCTVLIIIFSFLSYQQVQMPFLRDFAGSERSG